MALHANTQFLGEVENNLILDAEFARQLVNPNLLGGQSPVFSLLLDAPQGACRLGPQPDRPTSVARRRSISSVVTVRRSARFRAPRLTAVSKQVADPAHSQAPRPNPVRPTEQSEAAIRTSSSIPDRRRQPAQVRAGLLVAVALLALGHVRFGAIVGGFAFDLTVRCDFVFVFDDVHCGFLG